MKSLGISFDDIHSFYDLDLFLNQNGVVIPPAQPKIVLVDVAGGDGSLDMTEVHGDVKYYDRNCKFTFTVNPESSMTFEEKKTQVSNALNGKACKITLDNDENFYYIGRCTVNEYLQDRRLLQIVVTATVNPYKFNKTETVATFALTADEKTVNIKNGRKTVVPEITCTNDNTNIVFGNTTYSLSAGSHKILDIQFKAGNNELALSGTGTIIFKWQGAEL